MIATSIACLPIFFTGYRIGRLEGLLFFTMYICYTLYLIMAAAQHEALPAFSAAMTLFVLPLIAATLIVFTLKAYNK
jgi:cation:H+ antiporter